MDPHTTQLLADLREAAALPAECARAMPAGLYHSEEIYRLEQERIFGRGWLCAGRAAELPNAGDYLTFSIANQPILILRGEDLEFHAYSNVCLHRMMVLKEGWGSARTIVCVAVSDTGAMAALESFFDRVNAEDRVMVEGLYRGVQAPRARGGSLSWLERELHDFTRYLARMLTSDAPA
jgi:Rieske 2Fe-2S protein